MVHKTNPVFSTLFHKNPVNFDLMLTVYGFSASIVRNLFLIYNQKYYYVSSL